MKSSNLTVRLALPPCPCQNLIVHTPDVTSTILAKQESILDGCNEFLNGGVFLQEDAGTVVLCLAGKPIVVKTD